MASDVVLWGLFGAVILGLLALDLGLLRRAAHVVTFREALGWSAVWITAALGFNVLIYFWRGPEPAVEFLTGYLVEKALSVDQLFVFVLIFSHFRVPAQYQHTVLFWGIFGALVMRMLLIALGVTLIQAVQWVLAVFGAFLVFTAVRLLFHKDRPVRPEQNLLVRVARRFLPVSQEYAGSRFFIRPGGRLVATPLLLVLLVVETTDLIFALDSIPAILAITLDPFVVYTSNVFALLGMRSLYFALAGIIPFFHYLHHAFAGILAFAGAKMLLAEFYEIPDGAALGVVGGLLFVATVASVLRPRESQIEALLAQGTETGQFEKAEAELVGRIFHFSDRRVGSLMTPRPEVVWLDPRDSHEELARKISRAPDSQLPVARGGLDDVIGVVQAKDLLATLLRGADLDLVAAARRPLLVPEYLPALKALELFRQSHSDTALVVDEYGNVDGLVTLRDIAEAILGGVREPGALREPEIVEDGEGSWLLDGAVPVDQFTEALDLDPMTAEERALYHTVGGLAMHQLGRVPAAGDKFEWRQLRFEVVEMEGRRVGKLRVTRQQRALASAD
jgi:tellurite resistance protein TerC